MSKLISILERLLSVKRPYGGHGEGAAVLYMFSLAPERALSWIDGAGNLHVDLRMDATNRTLFIAHMDTMHRVDGPNLFTKDAQGMYHANGDVLGADDGAGAAILGVLMQSVPAYYVFCRGEECGGIGSTYIADQHPKLLEQFDRAIAFDRRGSSDVITHQGRGRCASDEFGEALSTALNDQGLLYMPSEHGIYTDTAEFVDLIPECTNISCGYQFEHSDKEQLDGPYLEALCQAALNVQWDELPTKRDPTAREPRFGHHVLATSLFDGLLAQAIEDALDGKPTELMKLVADEMKVSSQQIDVTLFDPAQVQYHVDGSTDSDDVLFALVNECEAEMVH